MSSGSSGSGSGLLSSVIDPHRTHRRWLSTGSRAEGLVDQGITVRLYVPFGDDSFRDWVRRKVEGL